jgi:hypothetical protein
VATFRHTDTSPKEQFLNHNAGLGGFGGAHGGVGGYIDHVVMRDRDANTAWTTASDGTLEERRYYCQNWRADVSAVLTSAGKLIEAIKNSSYGTPFGLPACDTDSDGDWDNLDSANVTSGSYDVRKDGELDGDADASDASYANAIISGGGFYSMGRGVLSSSAVGNRKGYAGYENDIYLFKLFHVRNRILDYVLGRWTRRDPLGYPVIASLYTYGAAAPLVELDSSGLRPEDIQWSWDFPPPPPLPNCAPVLAAALADPRVAAAMAAAAAACPGIPMPSLVFTECSGSDEGGFICTWFGPDIIELCRGGFGACPPLAQVISILLHELEHFKQSCGIPRAPGGSRCREWNFRSCRARLGHEIAGYCQEPSMAPFCAAAYAGNCAAAGWVCRAACASLPGWCYGLPWQSCQAKCLSRFGCAPAPAPAGPPALPPTAPTTPTPPAPGSPSGTANNSASCCAHGT